MYRRPVTIPALILLALCLLPWPVPAASANLIQGKHPGDRDVVVLIHGLGRSNAAMWLLNLRLREAGYYVYAVGYRSIKRSTAEILGEVSEQIDRCCGALPNRVHFVGHSLGGLMVRAYLQHNRLDNLGRVVLMGSPNQGTALADHFNDRWWATLAGPAPLELGTGADSFPKSLAEPYYPVGVIAGLHEGVGNDHILPGADDGLVAVDATRLPGMADFVVVDVGHSMMRYDAEVARQTLHFLRHERFDRAGGGGM